MLFTRYNLAMNSAFDISPETVVPNSENQAGNVADARAIYPGLPSLPPISTEETRALLRLANLQFTVKMTAALLEHFNWVAAHIFEASDAEFDAVPGFISRLIEKIRDPKLLVSDRQWSWLQSTETQILVANRADFPQQLLDIPDPPCLLFVRGKLTPMDLSGVGIVGSRNATPYGMAVAEKISRELAENGVGVISGGAIGIDTAAHRGALAAGGRTVAILGCGLDVDYPRTNSKLFEAIAEQGCVISEYALGSQPDHYRFPQRNRIISGLSLGTLVVEAPRPSGSLITARFAAEQGRPVLVIPANIDRPSSIGSNDLLKDGAIPVTETADILFALRLVAVPAKREHQTAMELNLASAVNDEGTAAKPAPSAISVADTVEKLCKDLPESQKLLVMQLTDTPQHIDTLAKAAGLAASTAGVDMTMLELAGLARRLPGNTYILAITA